MSPRERDIGPVGTAARVVGGLLAIGVPIALSGIGWWDAGIALVALPLITLAVGVVVVGAYRRYSPQSLGRPHAICSGPACVVSAAVIVPAIALVALTPAGAVAIWSFLGVSMLVAAWQGFGGCEVLAIPNAITGRKDQIGCVLYTPIDAAESRRADRTGGRIRAPA